VIRLAGRRQVCASIHPRNDGTGEAILILWSWCLVFRTDQTACDAILYVYVLKYVTPCLAHPPLVIRSNNV
jgi:hypothetical protein